MKWTHPGSIWPVSTAHNMIPANMVNAKAITISIPKMKFSITYTVLLDRHDFQMK